MKSFARSTWKWNLTLTGSVKSAEESATANAAVAPCAPSALNSASFRRRECELNFIQTRYAPPPGTCFFTPPPSPLRELVARVTSVAFPSFWRTARTQSWRICHLAMPRTTVACPKIDFEPDWCAQLAIGLRLPNLLLHFPVSPSSCITPFG